MILFIVVIVLLMVFLIPQHRLFREEKEKTQAYRFYEIRDELVWQCVQGEISLSEKKYSDLYDFLNAVVNDCRHLNFKFISKLAEHAAQTLLEKDEGRASEGQGRTPSKLHQMAAIATLEISWENSLFLRIMTKWKLTALIVFLRGINKYLEKSKHFQTVRNVNHIQRSLQPAV